METFIDNEGIFSMMLGVRFQVEDIKVANRIVRRLKQKNRLVENTLSIPLLFVAQSKLCICRAVQLASRKNPEWVCEV